MNRRNFLTTIGVVAVALALPKVALGREDRIITLDSPGHKIIRLIKNGTQIGCVYWANVDTKQYRRSAFWMDFADKPWDGGQIVRHPNMADKSKITYGPLHRADIDPTYSGPPPWGTRVAVGDNRETWTYPIDHYPVVSYRGQGPLQWDPKANTRTTPLSVEGIFDEIQISEDAPPEILALYPDIPRFKPFKPVDAHVQGTYAYEASPAPKRTEYEVKSARTADELADEMRRWVAGEDDFHDQVVKARKQQILHGG